MATRLDVVISVAQASKGSIRAAFIASVLGGGLMWQSSAIAAPKLQIVPSDRVFVSGVKSEKPTRSLVLRTDSKIDNLKVIPTDLMSKDGKAVFAAQWVKPAIPELMELKPGTPATIPIAFNLENLQTSGDFSGVLLIQYEGGETMIPLQVQVKDDWLVAGLCLGLGVGVALLLAGYQSEGLERDEILQRLGRVRLQMEADAQVPESFRASIQRGLIGIETALEERRWENAQQQAGQAQVIWDRWRMWKTDWLKQIEYKATQLDKCLKNEVATDNVYGRALKVSLERLTNQMATCETPEVWQGQLGEVQEQLAFYQKVMADLDRLGEQWDVVGQVDAKAAQGWSKVDFMDQLDELKPTDEDGKSKLEKAIAEAKQKNIDAKRELGAAAMTGQAAARGASRAGAVVEEPPSLSSTDPDKIVRVASAKLTLFRIAGQAIALGMLTGAGFQQLYLSNTTFGAGGVGDYLSLLGWGFGAEVTRDSVTKALKKMRLPGFKEE